MAGPVDDVVAESRRDRNWHDRGEAETGGEGLIVADNAIEDVLVVPDQIDLVHRQHDMANAEQRTDEGMPPGLHQHALARIDQDDGELRIGGAGRHVAGVLFMARRVRDHERASGRVEKPVGDVDGDALLALGLQPVDQKRKIDVVAGGAVLGAVALQRLELILIDHLAVVQQAADQGRFAVIDRAAGEEAQLVLGVGLAGSRACFRVHQK